MIPEGWERTTLGRVAKITSGGTPNRNKPEYWGGEIPWVTTGEIGNSSITSTSEHITELGLKNSSAKLFPPGTLLMAMYGQGKTRGKIAQLKIKATTNQACAAILTGSAADASFLFQNLTARYDEIRNLSNDGSQKNLSGGLLKALPILLPPPNERERIAAIMKTWDRAIEAVEALISNARAQKQALMQQLLPQGTTPPKKRLSGFSGAWQEAEFSEIFDLKIGGTPSRKNDAYWDGDKASQNRWVAISDLQSKYIDETQEHISDEGVENSNVKELAPGTVIFSFKLSIGRKAILRKSAFTNEAICALIPKRPEELSSLFVFHVLELIDFTASTDQAVKGATLNKSKIADLYLAFPSRAEQDRLVEVLEGADSEIDNLKSQRAALRQEKAALMQQLLTGKRRVKLPASEVV